MGGGIDRDLGCRDGRQRLAGGPRDQGRADGPIGGKATSRRGRAESEALRALEAEAATREQRDRAELEANGPRRSSSSSNRPARPGQCAITATRESQPDPDLKVRTALDRAAEKIGERFADQPLVRHRFARRSARPTSNSGCMRRRRLTSRRRSRCVAEPVGDDRSRYAAAQASLGVS